ncbi:MAG TPA: permease prefix domain 1-containing protein [Gemmatimonadaceae bacterium]|nr:permease prefix domain 1-containing protein [Gemmatimonadaceae bacterium]
MSARAALAGFVVRLRAHVFRGREEREMDEELQFHLEAETARNVDNGMSQAQAAALARRGFGIPAQHLDAMRDAVTWRWLEQLSQDVRV